MFNIGHVPRRNLLPYNRDSALQYAHKWAYARNPIYYDFEDLGGDCTNFVSQCLYAGSGVMNYLPVHGWYYVNTYNRTASWTGINYLYKFLITNTGPGPYAEEVDVSQVQPGDVVQVSFADKTLFNHSMIIVKTGSIPADDNILIAAHTFNADYYKLLDMEPMYIRYLHIIGVRD